MVMRFLIILLFSLLALWAYSGSVKGPFVFDDRPNILDNPHIRLSQLTARGIKNAGFHSPNKTRPVANISFALNHYAHEYRTKGYHLINILIHITTGILLYSLFKTTRRTPGYGLKDKYPPTLIPLFGALIWFANPLQTQSVSYIVQRMNSMAALFYVLSLLLYAKGRLHGIVSEKIGGSRNPGPGYHHLLFAGCAVSALLALGSKQIAATLPVFIFLYEWYFFQDLDLAWLKRKIFPLIGISLFFVLLAFFYTGGHPLERIVSSYELRQFTMIQRVLTEFRVVFFYITLLLFPHPSRLNLDHGFPISTSLVDPVTTLLSVIGVLGLMLLAVFRAKPNRLLSFSILWYLGNLVIESSVIGLEIIFEHRSYLPSMFVCLLIVTAVERGIRQKRIPVVLFIAVTAVLLMWTHERNRVWGDRLTLWADCAAKSPNSARSHNNLGLALTGEGRTEEAIYHFERALEINSGFLKAHNNLALALVAQASSLGDQGRTAEATTSYQAAIATYQKALEINPGHDIVHNNLGVVLVGQGRIEEGIYHYQRAIQIRPEYAEAHNNLGIALRKKGDDASAADHYLKALEIHPDYAEAHNNLGVVRAAQGQGEKAFTHFSSALAIDPGYVNALNNMGLFFLGQGDFQEAAGYFSRAVQAEPEDWGAVNHLGTSLAGQGKYEAAIGHYRRALELNPDSASVHNNMGTALARLGRLDAAAVHFRTALEIDPGFEKARINLERSLQMINRPAATK
jgi:tetratricopeptide (TPR) repeat protein